MDIIALPADVPALFDEAGAPEERVERLVREAFGIYERGAPMVRVMRDEPSVHPSVAEGGEQVEASLTALIDAAAITRADRAVTRAMIDLGTGRRSATRASTRPRRSRL